MISVAWFEATQSNLSSQSIGTDLAAPESSLWVSAGLMAEVAESQAALSWQWLSKWGWQRRSLECKKKITLCNTQTMKSHENQGAGCRSQLSYNLLGSLRGTSSSHFSNCLATGVNTWVLWCVSSMYMALGLIPSTERGGKANVHLACSTGILWTWSNRNKRNLWVKKPFMWLPTCHFMTVSIPIETGNQFVGVWI